MTLKNNQLFKSLSKDLTAHKGYQWDIGKWHTAKGKIKVCDNGYHASRRIVDAMYYVNLECLALVEVDGQSDKETDKEAWEKMKIVKAWKWEKEDSVKLAVFAAELVIDNFERKYPADKRPRQAIEAAKKWLNDPTEENRIAASAAANAAYATKTAAYATAKTAAYAAYAAAYAAYATTYAATKTAANAAVNAALDQCEQYILKNILPNLKEIKP